MLDPRAMKTVLFTAFILVAFASLANGLSSGAPDAACDAVSPDPALHLNAQSQTTPSPYNVSGLPLEYTPGAEYPLTFSGIQGQSFRGMLFVSENGAGLRVGAFISGADSRLTCADNRGITHNNANDKSSIAFTWVAPTTGSGPVTFRYAGVQVRNTYWANQVAGVVQEQQPITEAIAPTSAATTNTFTSTSFSPSPSPTPPPGNCTGVYCNNSYQRPNPYTCACECTNYCNGSLQPNPSTCECECPYLRSESDWMYRARECARYYYGSSTFNPVTCDCDCVQLNDCDYNQYFDNSSCSCECNNYYSCSEGMYFNSDSCRCECSNKYCPPGFYLNSNTCECECNNYCNYDEILDIYTCQCRKKSQYPDVQCSSLQTLYACINAESLFGISCLWQNEVCITECCSPKPSRNPHLGFKLCPHLDYYRCSKIEYCNWRCGDQVFL